MAHPSRRFRARRSSCSSETRGVATSGSSAIRLTPPGKRGRDSQYDERYPERQPENAKVRVPPRNQECRTDQKEIEDRPFGVSVVCARRKRANRPRMGSRIEETAMLAEPNALFAAQLVSCSAFAMARQDALPVRAVVVIVIDVPMLGRILSGVCVVRRHLRHRESFPATSLGRRYYAITKSASLAPALAW